MNKRIKTFLLVLTCFVITLFTPAISFATDDTDFYSGNDIFFYNSSDCSTTANNSSTLTGNDNLEKILRYLVGKGLTLEQASGIAGNLKAESGFDPYIIEGGAEADENYTPVSGVGFGIAQWTYYNRQDNLVALAQSSNRKVTDLSLQLDFLWQELTGNYSDTYEALQTATTPEDAAYIFHEGFENSNDSEEAIRANRGGPAREIYEAYKSIISSGSSSSSSSSSSCPTNGTASQYVDGFAIYDQFDSQWANNSYGDSTISSAGCGPSAMAMIITALTGQTVTPADTAAYGEANGTVADGGGSRWNIQTVIGEHWGLKSEQLDGSVDSINNALRNGALIITSGVGSNPFTSSGHYIVIRAVTSDGKWLIGDSAGNIGASNSEKEWDPDEIISNGMAEGNVWAVTK